MLLPIRQPAGEIHPSQGMGAVLDQRKDRLGRTLQRLCGMRALRVVTCCCVVLCLTDQFLMVLHDADECCVVLFAVLAAHWRHMRSGIYILRGTQCEHLACWGNNVVAHCGSLWLRSLQCSDVLHGVPVHG